MWKLRWGKELPYLRVRTIDDYATALAAACDLARDRPEGVLLLNTLTGGVYELRQLPDAEVDERGLHP